MKQKLDKILLIDDSEADNFFHKRVIKKADVSTSIIVKYNGQEALDYLTTKEGDKYPQPNLVFLDINMPGMDGWEFLEHYNKLPGEQKADVIICMLTTSIADRDREKSTNYGDLNAYQNKPLTEKKLMELIKLFFPQNL